jgi:hypothetical protein
MLLPVGTFRTLTAPEATRRYFAFSQRWVDPVKGVGRAWLQFPGTFGADAWLHMK